MPYSQLSKDLEPVVKQYCEQNGLGFVKVDLQDIRKAYEIQELKLHGIPTVRLNDSKYNEVFGEFTVEDLDKLTKGDNQDGSK